MALEKLVSRQYKCQYFELFFLVSRDLILLCHVLMVIVTEMWLIESSQEGKTRYPEDMHGRFFSEDSYIILYTYRSHGSDKFVIYFWQGRDSSVVGVA